jgi:large subunit ribosomal protein L29
MSDDKIGEALENAREEMFNLRFRQASAQLEDLSQIRKVRREIAQMETVLRLRQLAVERALEKPEVAEALNGKEWYAEAHFDYVESAWIVLYLDDDDKEITKSQVNLNRKQVKGRKARRLARI